MAWERLRRKCRSGIISPCSRTFPARCCPRLPGIAHDCPLKKCRKPWWPRNTAVDLAALDVSRAPLRDSPAVRLSKRIMNQGLSWRAAQSGANSEVFTNHESRNTNHGFFSPWVRQGGATGNRRPDHCARRQVTVSRFTVVHHCSRLFAIVQQKILLCASVIAPPGHCFPARRGAAIARHARGEWGVRQCPCPVSRSRSALRRASPAGQLPRTQNKPMLRKGNVPACMSRQVVRRTACLLQTGVLEQYVEHGKQALRSPGARIACFDRRVVRNAGWVALTVRRQSLTGNPEGSMV